MSSIEKAFGLVPYNRAIDVKDPLDGYLAKSAVREECHRVSSVARNRLALLALALVGALHVTSLPIAATACLLFMSMAVVRAVYFHFHKPSDVMIRDKTQDNWRNLEQAIPSLLQDNAKKLQLSKQFETSIPQMDFLELEKVATLKNNNRLNVQNSRIPYLFQKRFLELCLDQKLGWEQSIKKLEKLFQLDQATAISLLSILNLPPQGEERELIELSVVDLLKSTHPLLKNISFISQLCDLKLRQSPPAILEDLRLVLHLLVQLIPVEPVASLAMGYAQNNTRDLLSLDDDFNKAARLILKACGIHIQDSELNLLRQAQQELTHLEEDVINLDKEFKGRKTQLEDKKLEGEAFAKEMEALNHWNEAEKKQLVLAFKNGKDLINAKITTLAKELQQQIEIMLAPNPQGST